MRLHLALQPNYRSHCRRGDRHTHVRLLAQEMHVFRRDLPPVDPCDYSSVLSLGGQTRGSDFCDLAEHNGSAYLEHMDGSQKHEFLRWNPEIREWFCLTCGRTSDHEKAMDARIELEEHNCEIPFAKTPARSSLF